MRLVRRVLRWQATLWFASGTALVFAPGWLVESALDQPPLGEDAWLRIAGVMAMALAGQMVLVGRRVEELWWWSWTFALLEAGVALVFVANALFGLAKGAAAWPWWLLTAVNAGFAVLDVVALARTGTERSPA
jgi:hypothetical protein